VVPGACPTVIEENQLKSKFHAIHERKKKRNDDGRDSIKVKKNEGKGDRKADADKIWGGVTSPFSRPV